MSGITAIALGGPAQGTFITGQGNTIEVFVALGVRFTRNTNPNDLIPEPRKALYCLETIQDARGWRLLAFVYWGEKQAPPQPETVSEWLAAVPLPQHLPWRPPGE